MRREGMRILAAVVVAGVAGGVAVADRVETRKGAVEGTVRENGVRAFLAIPFAEPPVGELRWKGPRPAPRWEGVREAKAFAPGPIQNALVAAMTGAPLNFSEDCLYLNVWTPAGTADERLPVMVWIYGGAFAMGSTNVPLYDGAKLAEKGVVVVSIAYRVGPLGFLAHPELSREGGGVSGNYGLRDQVAGLEWVRDEIEAFGGDPDRVTIFGESAGAISVSMLAASPRAKGLFHRAISQSGGSFAPAKLADEGGLNVRPLKLAEAEGERFLDDLGVADLAAARALPAADLLKLPRWWWPNFDGDVLPGDQYELYRAGRFHDTPILIGANSDEGAMFVRPGPSTSPERFAELVRAGYGEHAEKVLAAYPHATPDEAFKATKDLFRDSVFGWNTWAWARLQAEKGANPAFVYYFDRRSPSSPDGSSHAAEIPFVFRNLDALGGLFGPAPKPEDVAASDLISACWVNFAKTGDPNGEGLPPWPPFAPDDPKVLHLDAAPSARPVPNLPQLQALDAYYAWRRERANGKP
ncbi:carboxylesterase/lipase family protein [Planctomyces sp. SH-PL62]|uniref:carboxylesterase/lipase family protein n=1 Tax=Planctomyces sp. SH-PL62 TaxID=1636152 RepID=UPI00078B37A8|nr:carboxylesterase family protein [Planctomyces sp. SH-PL62]AMV37817.1 Para-nitrobenzyl esterase [Planctomyces sp. SH-PL62]